MKTLLNLKEKQYLTKIREMELDRSKINTKIQSLIERERKIIYSTEALSNTIREGREVYDSDSGLLLREKCQWVEKAQYLKAQSHFQLSKIILQLELLRDNQTRVNKKLNQALADLEDIKARVKFIAKKEQLAKEFFSDSDDQEVIHLGRS